MEKVTFDKSKEFEVKVVPLLKQIEEMCIIHKIPFFFSAVTKNEDGKTTYYNAIQGPIAMNMALADDQITKHLKIASGSDALFVDTLPDIKLS